jgi:hypothetical protein
MSMNSAPVFFSFQSKESVRMAYDTLAELGYQPHLEETETPTLHIHVDDQDLSSALQIVQAHGGEMVERSGEINEPEAYERAYHMDDIRIPAHLVNEDIPDAEAPHFDPSEDDYDQFSGGIHI